MKPTGYALMALAVLLLVFVGANHLAFDAQAVETAEPNASTSNYLLALIPATVAAIVGLYLVMIPHRGYKTTYDMGKQQAGWNA